MNLMDKISSLETLDTAYDWCVKSRAHFPDSSDIWIVSERWAQLRRIIQENLRTRKYVFSPMEGYVRHDSTHLFWSAENAIVVKAIAIVLSRYLSNKLISSCVHTAGKGGMPEAIARLRVDISEYKFFVRSDVQDYYASINHECLIRQLKLFIPDTQVLDLVIQTIKRTECVNGNYVVCEQGIPLRSALSPLLAACALHELDAVMRKEDITYIRYMDDWVILAHTRSRLKHYIRLMYEVLNRLKLRAHPDKTSMGRISDRQINFLGFSFGGKSRVEVSVVSLGKFLSNLKALINAKTDEIHVRIYFKCWCGWVIGVTRRYIMPDASLKIHVFNKNVC